MRDYSDEAYLHARIYAMRSRLLSLNDYAAMIGSQKAEINDGDKIFGISDPVETEEAAFQKQIAGLMPLTETIAGYTPLFLSFFRQFEALNVKVALAKAFNLQVIEQWFDIGSYAVLKRKLLKDTITIQNLKTSLSDTYLADVFKDTSSYEQMEANVDLCAVKQMYGASFSLKADKKIDFQNLTARRLAVTTTLLSWRLKKNYRWDAERTGSYLKIFHDLLGETIYPHIKTVEEVLDTYLEQMRTGSGQEPSVVDMEHYLEQYYCNWISRMFHRDFNSIGCVVAYLWLLFYQIRNLFKIMEGKRFGYSAESILSTIVCSS